VGPDVWHVRLGEQPQEAELDVAPLAEPRRVVVDGILPVTDRGWDVAEPPDMSAGRGEADREVEQRT
jgi:hypothetical protein